MLIDLHVYTEASGGPSLDDAIASFKAANLDAMCVVDRQASGEVARRVAAGGLDFPVFVGVEIPTRTGDVVVITPKLDPFMTREEWRQLEVLELPTIEQVQELVAQEGGVVLVAHPYDRNRRNGPRDRIFAFEGVSAIEVSTASADRSANDTATESVSHASVPAFAGSSATSRDRGNGSTWATFFAAEVSSQEELVAAIQSGDFWAVELTDKNSDSRGRGRGGGGRSRDSRGGDGGRRSGGRGSGRRGGGGGGGRSGGRRGGGRGRRSSSSSRLRTHRAQLLCFARIFVSGCTSRESLRQSMATEISQEIKSVLTFSMEAETEFQKITGKYPNQRAALLPVLYLAQKEFGYLRTEVIEYVAERLDLPASKVLQVATFYTMYAKRPIGEHWIEVCTSVPCCAMGGYKLLRYLEGQARRQSRRDDQGQEVHADRSGVSCGVRAGTSAAGGQSVPRASREPWTTAARCSWIRTRSTRSWPATSEEAWSRFLPADGTWTSPTDSRRTRMTVATRRSAKSLNLDKASIVEEVKKSNLRGRGGAGLPDRDQVELPAEGIRRSQVPRHQRGRRASRARSRTGSSWSSIHICSSRDV